jgi:hypothetical protein
VPLSEGAFFLPVALFSFALNANNIKVTSWLDARGGSMPRKRSGRKYGKKASQKVKRAMHERKHGTLKSGRSGKKVKSRKQAIAIGLSEARKSGAKVPKKRSSPKKK